MITRLARVTIYVRDQDEALRFYTETLGLEKRADVTFGPGARWLTVAPAGQRDVEILLQSGVPALHGEEFAQKIGERVGQGTTWVFATDDCRGDYETLKARRHLHQRATGSAVRRRGGLSGFVRQLV